MMTPVKIVQITSLLDNCEQRFGEFWDLKAYYRFNDDDETILNNDRFARCLIDAESHINDVLKSNATPCIIVINTHGRSDDGCYFDKFLGREYLVTPYILWNGLTLSDGRPWNGLGHIFSELSTNGMPNGGKRIYIVAAQCFGSHFARELRGVAKSAENKPTNVIICGLSYKETYSRKVPQLDLTRNLTQAEASRLGNSMDVALHNELDDFVEKVINRKCLKSSAGASSMSNDELFYDFLTETFL